PAGLPSTAVSTSRTKPTRSAAERSTRLHRSSAPSIATQIAEEPPRPEPYGTADVISISRGRSISRAARSDPARAVRGSVTSPAPSFDSLSHPAAAERTTNRPSVSRASHTARRSIATLTVTEPGWRTCSGHRSSVPPARSMRAGAVARTITERGRYQVGGGGKAGGKTVPWVFPSPRTSPGEGFAHRRVALGSEE